MFLNRLQTVESHNSSHTNNILLITAACDKFCGIFSNLPSEFWRSVLAEQWYLNETELAYMPDKYV